MNQAEAPAKVRTDIACEAAGKKKPYHGPSPAAYAAAQVLSETIADAGMRPPADFTECLATVIDVHAAVADLIEAVVQANELCSSVLVNGTAPAARFRAVAAQLQEALERAHVPSVPFGL
jgi:hypothetical protein